MENMHTDVCLYKWVQGFIHMSVIFFKGFVVIWRSVIITQHFQNMRSMMNTSKELIRIII